MKRPELPAVRGEQRVRHSLLRHKCRVRARISDAVSSGTRRAGAGSGREPGGIMKARERRTYRRGQDADVAHDERDLRAAVIKDVHQLGIDREGDLQPPGGRGERGRAAHLVRRRVVEDRVLARRLVAHDERLGHLAVDHRAHRRRRDRLGVARLDLVERGEGEGCRRQGGREVVLGERAARVSSSVQGIVLGERERTYKRRVNLNDSASAARARAGVSFRALDGRAEDEQRTVEGFAKSFCGDGHLIAADLQGEERTVSECVVEEGRRGGGRRTKLTSPPDSHTASAPTTAMSHLRGTESQQMQGEGGEEQSGDKLGHDVGDGRVEHDDAGNARLVERRLRLQAETELRERSCVSKSECWLKARGKWTHRPRLGDVNLEALLLHRRRKDEGLDDNALQEEDASALCVGRSSTGRGTHTVAVHEDGLRELGEESAAALRGGVRE